MQPQITPKGDTLMIKLFGEIDHHASDAIRERVDLAFDRPTYRHIVFDFSQVTFMDSSGIGMLIGRYKNAEKRGGSVAVSGMSVDLRRIFAVSGLAKIIGYAGEGGDGNA